MNENAYKTMKSAGACGIALGVLVVVIGVTVGILQIIQGGKLLKAKKDVTF
ncbi:MAG: hypothetical protein K2I10_11015 [Lachnospiraceae bacterium]|nr:hypothetical protein [Lachnospiraceae bacterium]